MHYGFPPWNSELPLHKGSSALTVQETKAMWAVQRQMWGDAVAEQRSELRKIAVHTSGVEGKLKSFGSFGGAGCWPDTGTQSTQKTSEQCPDSDMGQREKISSCVSTELQFRGELTGSSGHSWTTQTFQHLSL